MKMSASTRQVGGVTVVATSGRIELSEESAAVRDLISKLLDNGPKPVLLNLADVNYIDSSGLGALVSCFTSARKQGGELNHSRFCRQGKYSRPANNAPSSSPSFDTRRRGSRKQPDRK